ncbi:MAG: GMC family oxidoreductase [Myxococcota bacterium]|nr:GMC family oxidoreductase [Myxococcota bacterium]
MSELSAVPAAPKGRDTTLVSGFSYRAALALAEAIIPGSPGIPPADEATVARTDDVVDGFHPGLAKAWRIAQATLAAAAIARTGRSFDALSAARQEALIRQWEDDPILRIPLGLVALVYKFVHFDQRSVYGAMGGKLNVVEALETPRWLRQVHRAEDWESSDAECDVVVVGTGAGGAVVGRELADRGFAVVFVEEGDLHRRDAFDGSSVSAHQRFYRGAFSVGNVGMPVFMGRLVGGSTAINGGTCLRAPPWALDRWCEDTDNGEFADDVMAPYFDRVEQVLEVQSSDRRRIGPIADVMARGCNALGWKHFAIRRNAPGCDGSGFCDFGCRTDARRGTNIAYIPPALEKGALLLTGLRAERVVVEGRRACGVDAVTKDGRSIRVRARAVVLAGGAIPTPLLLLKQGICNTSDQVGRNLTAHPSSGFSALFDEDIRGYAHIPQGYGCDEFLRDGILITAAQPDLNIAAAVLPFAGRRLMEILGRIDKLAYFALMVSDSTRNGRVWRDVGGLPAITYSIAPADVERMHRAMIHTAEMCLAAGAMRLHPTALKMRILNGARDVDAFRKAKLGPADVIWTSYHPLGTCKMGRDPKTSVVDGNHEAHDVRGLYIVDGSTVPGPLGVNPQLTIMAMATRAAVKIAERL